MRQLWLLTVRQVHLMVDLSYIEHRGSGS